MCKLHLHAHLCARALTQLDRVPRHLQFSKQDLPTVDSKGLGVRDSPGSMIKLIAQELSGQQACGSYGEHRQNPQPGTWAAIVVSSLSP